MGREIRRVVPNWEHPKETKLRMNYGKAGFTEDYHPLFDQDFETAMKEWLSARRWWRLCKALPNFTAWVFVIAKKTTKAGKTRSWFFWHLHDLRGEHCTFVEWHGAPPDPDYYRPKWADGEATWYQMYETVSEGTPVTPPFESKEELATHLMRHGTFWDNTPWSDKAAANFVGAGWAPSMVVSGNKIMNPREMSEEGALQ